MTMDALAHPLVQSVLLPATVAGVLLVLGRLTAFPGVVAAAASAALVVCLLSALGLAPWPPRSGLHKLVWLLALASVLAPLLAVRCVPAVCAAMARGAFVVFALAWLAWPRLGSAQGPDILIFVAGVAGTLVITFRPGAGHATPASTVAMLGVGALCLVAVSLIASSLILMQLGGALAVVCGVLFAWSLWPMHGSADAALAGAGDWGRVCLVLLAALIVLLTRVPGWPLAMLVALAYADVPVGTRVPCRWRALAVAAVAMLPALVIIALMLWLGGAGEPADDAYYRG